MREEAKRLKPDDVIPPDRSSIQARQLLRDTAFLFPNLVKLITRLIRDPRVPRRSKIVLGAALAYVVSPVDLIPEVIPVLGWADDALLVMLALDSLIERAGPEVVREHWDGPGDLLELVREVVAVSRSLVPRRLGGLFDRLTG